jgi:hypothetical protein
VGKNDAYFGLKGFALDYVGKNDTYFGSKGFTPDYVLDTVDVLL